MREMARGGPRWPEVARISRLQNHARTPRQAALRHVDIGKDVVAHVQELLAAATRHLLDHACVSAGVLPAQLHAKRLTQHPIGRRHLSLVVYAAQDVAFIACCLLLAVHGLRPVTGNLRPAVRSL